MKTVKKRRDLSFVVADVERGRADSGGARLDAIVTEIKAATLHRHVPTYVTADLNNGAIFSRGGGQLLVCNGP